MWLEVMVERTGFTTTIQEVKLPGLQGERAHEANMLFFSESDPGYLSLRLPIHPLGDKVSPSSCVDVLPSRGGGWAVCVHVCHPAAVSVGHFHSTPGVIAH